MVANSISTDSQPLHEPMVADGFDLKTPMNDHDEDSPSKAPSLIAARGTKKTEPLGIDVRFKNLSIVATVAAPSTTASATELPTLTNSIALAWRSCFAKQQATKIVLHNISGVFKPSTMTLVLGQPGSGKSSLMKILSGRFPMSNAVKIDGEITFNGIGKENIAAKLPQLASYVMQRDHHSATLSVRETLAFAHECCGVQANDTPLPSAIITQLGLDSCADTLVGDAMVRGVSGGERKRVTLGEMQFGAKPVAFMDEITTGLDSAATFDIIEAQRRTAVESRKTFVLALLQPSPEVFALFDDVMLLNDGHVIYHGPRESVMAYFESLGFKCPPHRDAADFLMDIGTPQQVMYQAPVKNGYIHPRTASEFAELFAASAIHEAMMHDLHCPQDASVIAATQQYVDTLREYQQDFWPSTATLSRRQLKLTLRNGPFLKGRAFMVLVMGVLYAALFWQFDVANVQVVMGLLFASVLFLALGQASQMPTYLASREVFYKQRGANFFRTSSYVVALSVSQQPIAIPESLVFGSMVYWACGFAPVASAFALFQLLIFLTNLAFAAWFFFLAAISPNLHIAKPLGMVCIMFYILFAGFVIVRTQIPGYYLWAYWLNPIAWCLRSVAINQYRQQEFNVDVYAGVEYFKRYGMQMGEYSLGLFDLPAETEWLWYGVAYLVLSYVVFMTLSYLALEYKRYEAPETAGRAPANEAEHSGGGDTQFYLLETPKTHEPFSTDDTSVEIASLPHRFVVPVTVAFRELSYAVPNPANPQEDLILLKGISGFATPGTVTALMGSTGAGKTTLMDVIAGRKTGGKIEGQILLNGFPATDLAIRRATGYCEQMDIHSEASTIREALTFSAFLRQDASVSDAQKYDSVEEVLDLLDLRPIADQIIRGSSVEQMKRLTIGVELAAQPSVLFLDEPTSGLDARSAKVIMDGVRKVADTGRTVVCTIHQPSWEVFQVFDSLLLLKKGGETVYFGELGQNASELIAYFQSVEGTLTLEEGYNPATWMLEVIGAGVGNTAAQDIDFVQIFKQSPKKKLLDAKLEQDGVTRPGGGMPALSFTTKRAAGSLTQAKLLITRSFDIYWRTPSYNVTRFIVYMMLAIIFGTSFLAADYDTYQGINAGEGVVFVTTAFLGLLSFNSVLPIAMEERPSFYRERSAQTYSAFWYFVGITVVEIPYVLTSTLLYTAIFFPLVGFTGAARFVLYWLSTALFVLLQAYLGQLFAFALPSVEVAAILGVLMNSVFFMFMGFNPPASAVPSAFKWLYHITPHQYALAVLSAIVFGDCGPQSPPTELACQLVKDLPPTQPQGLTVKLYVEQVFLMKHGEIGVNVAILLAFMAFFRVLALLALRFVNHQKK